MFSYSTFYYPGSRISYNTNKRVLIITCLQHHVPSKLQYVRRLASIQIHIKLETNVFMAWAVNYCFMSMISFMTGTCEAHICILDISCVLIFLKNRSTNEKNDKVFTTTLLLDWLENQVFFKTTQYAFALFVDQKQNLIYFFSAPFQQLIYLEYLLYVYCLGF